MSEVERIHRCQFCGKTFARKSWFLRHSCAKKRKFEETNDVIVQQAFRVWSYWMQAQNMIKRGKQPDFDKFLKSPLKKSFIDLTLFAREKGVHSTYSYIDWIIETRVPERDWCKEETVEAFKEHTKTNEDPEDQALWMFNEIEKWILDDPDNRTPQDYYDKLSPGVILTMVRQRRIKPWVLFAYDPIASKWLNQNKYDAEVYYRIDDIVNCTYWADKLENEPDSVELVRTIMDQLWEYQT